MRQNIFILALTILCGISSAAEAKPKPASRGAIMDYGPFLQYTVTVTENADIKTQAEDDESAAPAKTANANPKSKKELTLKGTAIKVGKGGKSTMLFDTDTLRYSAGWTGGFLNLSASNMCNSKGTACAFSQGAVHFSNPDLPGWTYEDSFRDPRPDKLGPIPADLGRYTGLYLNGEQVVLSYTIGTTAIWDQPGLIEKDTGAIFTRTIHLDKTSRPLTALVCELDGAKGQVEGPPGSEMALLKGATVTLASTKGVPAGAKWVVNGDQIWLKLPVLTEPATFTLALWNGPVGEQKNAEGWLKELPSPVDPTALCKGGTPHWNVTVDTVGTLSTANGAYVVDNIAIPEENPWKAWMRLTAVDFFTDGRMAVSTWNGDVWIASGIDEKLAKISWKRFATGLYEPLGLKIIDNKVYVRGRDQITILNDLNGDGEADFYENFSNFGGLVNDYHCFLFDLHTDRAGNVYYIPGGNRVKDEIPFHGDLLKTSKDGKKTEVVASGFRAPNGFAIGPNDEIVCGDNQGHWTPASKINWIEKGKFYGYIGDPRYKDEAYKEREKTQTKYDPPLCWIPYGMDNSCGGQVFAPAQNWGPLSGMLLHTSYGKSCLFWVLTEKVGNVMQGGVVRFPLEFPSGIMRGRVNPKDNQVYLSGLRGWQTNALHDGCISRIRYTGKPTCIPVGLNITKTGVKLTFSEPLDKASAGEAANYTVQQWNYKWTEKYGSPDVSVKDPAKQVRDTLEVKSVKVSEDKKCVELDLGGVFPVMQMSVKFKLSAADGSTVKYEIGNTINAVP